MQRLKEDGKREKETRKQEELIEKERQLEMLREQVDSEYHAYTVL